MFTTIRTTYTESTDMAREGLHWQNRTWSSINHQCVQHLCCHVLNHEDQKLTENCSRSLWRKLPWDSGASSFAKNRLQSIHGSKYCDYDSFRKHCCWYDWNRTPECNGKECICVILQSDKVISHLLAVFNISTHLPDFKLFSVFLFVGNTLRWKRCSPELLPSWLCRGWISQSLSLSRPPALVRWNTSYPEISKIRYVKGFKDGISHVSGVQE